MAYAKVSLIAHDCTRVIWDMQMNWAPIHKQRRVIRTNMQIIL